MPDSPSREDFVYLAKLAGEAERYEGLILIDPPLYLLPPINYLSQRWLRI
jgi:hypothetical protein